MKKIYLIIACSLFLGGLCMAQPSGKFAASVSNSGNVLTFSLRPLTTNSAGFSTIEFFLRYPVASPVFTYGTVVPNTTNFPGMTASGTGGSGSWEIEHNNSIYVIPGYNVDHFIYTGPAPVTTLRSYTAGTSYDVFSVPLLGTPNTVNFQFVHQDSEDKYYLAISDENGFDKRPVAFTSYFYPTTNQTAGPSASVIYYMDLLNVPVPVKFMSFTATRRDNDALLAWSVENESPVTDRYEVERSLNGVDFIKAATVAAKNNGNSANSYNLTDFNLAGLRSAGIIYYRIKQIDKDGKAVYTEIRSVRLDGKGTIALINIYPNPVRDNAIVMMDLADDANVTISVSDAAGKEVQKINIQAFKGMNNKKVSMSNYAAGTYLFRVTAGAETKTISVVKQ